MFLPFLPYIFALAGASLLLLERVPPPPALGLTLPVQVGLALAVPLLLGWLVGLLPNAWVGPRLPLRTTRRRWLTLTSWMAVCGFTPVVPYLLQIFTALLAQWATVLGWPALNQGAEEVVIGVLLADYWLADTLTLRPPRFRDGSEAALSRHVAAALGAEPGFFRVLLLPVPFLALVVIGMGASGGMEGGIEGLLARFIVPGIGGTSQSLRSLVAVAIGAGFTVISLMVLLPVLIRWCWDLKPLFSREAERAIQDELAANGVKVARVLTWPEHMTGVVTAGVIGVLPSFRYLLFGNLLVAALTPDEIRSVTAHEAAHLRYRHPLYYVFAVVACILLVQSFSQLLQLAGLLLANPVPAWLAVLGELAALLFALRFGFGTLSRHFERQADGHAFQRQGLDAFQTALSKVAKLNGIPAEINNWHHYGISHRIGYLAQVQAHPDRLSGHTRTVNRHKVLWAVLLAVGLALQIVVSATPLVSQAAQGYWEQRIGLAEAGRRPLTSDDLPGLHALAMLAYEQQDLARAERYYRLILGLAPDDAQTQNNLAWLLVTRPSADAATIREGLALAKQAARAQDMAFIWDTLAEAYGKSGQTAAAHAAAARALRLAEEGRGLGEAGIAYYRQRINAYPEGSGPAPMPDELSRPAPMPAPGRRPSRPGPAPVPEPPRRFEGIRMV